MTLEELKNEADKLGYNLVRKSPGRTPMIPCKNCGRQRIHVEWGIYHGVSGWRATCPKCGAEGPISTSENHARIGWNAWNKVREV